jgi:hypothetical protein
MLYSQRSSPVRVASTNFTVNTAHVRRSTVSETVADKPHTTCSSCIVLLEIQFEATKASTINRRQMSFCLSIMHYIVGVGLTDKQSADHAFLISGAQLPMLGRTMPIYSRVQKLVG